MILKCQCLIIIFLLLEFSEGSIIASINVSFLAIDALQLISLQEELAGGTLGTTSAELLNLSSSYGKDTASVTELKLNGLCFIRPLYPC